MNRKCSCGPCSICQGEIQDTADLQHVLDCLVRDHLIDEDGYGRYRTLPAGEAYVKGATP